MDKPCKLWQGALSTKGYGVTTRHNKYTLVHRQTYEDAHGPIPPGLVVRHKCDVRACWEIEHLELGTYQQNTQDMLDRGRARGGRPRSIPDETNMAILKLLSEGATQMAAAKAMGVSSHHVSKLKLGKYKHGKR